MNNFKETKKRKNNKFKRKLVGHSLYYFLSYLLEVNIFNSNTSMINLTFIQTNCVVIRLWDIEEIS